MTHKEYLEMLIGPLAGEGGGGGITPSGSITINKNTNGVDVSSKATAVVAVQGGLDADYVPYVIPTGYTEYPCVEDKTREQIETYDPQGETASRFWVVWDDTHPPVSANGALIAVTGVTSDTHDPYMVIGHTIGSSTAGDGRQRIRIAYDAPPTFGVGNPVMDITANGNNIDVKGRNAVNVNVPTPQPSGSVTITQNTDSNGVDVSGKSKAIVDIQGGLDYDFVQPSVPAGYTEVQGTSNPSSSTINGYRAGQSNKQISVKLPLSVTLTNGDKISITGTTSDTGDAFVVSGTVSGKTTYSTYQYAKLNVDYDGKVGVTNPSLTIKSNTTTDVKGRDTVVTNVHGSGTIQINQNGQVSVDGYAYADVNVQSAGGNVTCLDGVVMLATNGISASYRQPNTGVVALQLPTIESIGDNNFIYFGALKEVAIGAECRQIGSGVFDQCSRLQAIVFDRNIQMPPSMQYPPNLPQTCMIYVPDEQVLTWQQAQGWSYLAQQIASRQGMPWSETFAPFMYGDIVTHGGDMWICLSDYVTSEPGVGQEWSIYSP